MSKQPNLFDDVSPVAEPPASASNALVITAAKLGPEQKLFNQLLTKIEKYAKDLDELKRMADVHRLERSHKLGPLEQQSRQMNEKMVLFLDQRLQSPKGLSKKQQADVAYIASSLVEMLVMTGQASPELEAAIERLCPEIDDDDVDADELKEAEAELKEMMAELGLDMETEADFDSPEAFIEATMRKMQAEREAAQEAHQAKRKSRKKTAKQLQAEQETMDADTALRTIYRKLASALHPDREPNEAERVRKTQMMGRVNAANDAKDLLTLLRLQLEIEQIDPLAIAAMADDKLRHYNRMLKEQAKSVQQELMMMQYRLRDEWDLGYGPVTAKSMHTALRQQMQQMQNQLDFMQRDFQLIQDDKQLKTWAKEQVAMMDAPMDAFDIAMVMHGR
jgi:phage gp37-like protein